MVLCSRGNRLYLARLRLRRFELSDSKLPESDRSREGLLQELSELRAAIQARARTDALLNALNQTSLAIGMALTPDEIFAAMAAELEELGLSCMVLPFDKSQENLQTSYVNMIINNF